MDYRTSLYNREHLQNMYFYNYKLLVSNMLNIISKLNIPLYGEYALKDYYDFSNLKKTLPIQVVVVNEDLHVRLLKEIFGKDNMNYFDDVGKSTIFIKKGDVMNQIALKVPLLNYNRIYKQHLSQGQYQVHKTQNKLNMRYITPMFCLIDVLYKMVNSINNIDDWALSYKLYKEVLGKMNIKASQSKSNNSTSDKGFPAVLTTKSDNILYEIYQSCIKDKEVLLTGEVISDFFLGTVSNIDHLDAMIYPGSTLISDLNQKYEQIIGIKEVKIHHFLIRTKYLIEIDKKIVMNIYSINTPISFIQPNIPNIYGHILCMLMIHFIIKRNNHSEQLNAIKKLMALETNIDKNNRHTVFQSNVFDSFYDFNCSTLQKIINK